MFISVRSRWRLLQQHTSILYTILNIVTGIVMRILCLQGQINMVNIQLMVYIVAHLGNGVLCKERPSMCTKTSGTQSEVPFYLWKFGLGFWHYRQVFKEQINMTEVEMMLLRFGSLCSIFSKTGFSICIFLSNITLTICCACLCFWKDRNYTH